jgi:hypothetical protein
MHPNSSVIDFLQATRMGVCRDGRRSWQVVNRSMQQALSLCISARFAFELEDFKRLAEQCEGQIKPLLDFPRWVGVDNGINSGESFYTLAVKEGNLSACRAFEHWKNRKPFTCAGERLHIGSKVYIFDPSIFSELGEADQRRARNNDNLCRTLCCMEWHVNSFSEDGRRINIAYYEGDRTLSKKKSLTLAEVRAIDKSFKERSLPLIEVADAPALA